MAQQDDRLESLRVASPCPVSWESMRGSDRSRFCEQCQLNVYDISELTGRQARALISRTEGRICARLYRRADGTVLTKDCPVGLRAFRRRIARAAGAAFTALLGLSANALGQTLTHTSRHDSGSQQATLTRKFFALNPQEGRATFWGILSDPTGAALADASATIINQKTKYKRTVKTNDKGQFKFGLLEAGTYTLTIEAPGFREYKREHMSLHSNEDLRFDISLSIPSATVGVIVCEEPPTKGIVIDGVRLSINED